MRRPLAVGPLVACVLAALAALVGGGACSRTVETLRVATYGPDLRYIEPARLSDTMNEMTRAVVDLQRRLRGGAPGSPEDKEAVRRLADVLEALGRKLDTGGRPTNHPVLDRNLPYFRSLIGEASRGIRATPPNYFFAASIVGSCLLCHGKRR